MFDNGALLIKFFTLFKEKSYSIAIFTTEKMYNNYHCIPLQDIILLILIILQTSQSSGAYGHGLRLPCPSFGQVFGLMLSQRVPPCCVINAPPSVCQCVIRDI